ncbi:MAG TPA: hypothetical protein VMT99_01120 [Candidatus Paceibacterota bacterium]|nr:hypothetical protein [Candidatus Paceibacterota bacterium]
MPDPQRFASDEEAFLEVDRLMVEEGWSFVGNIFKADQRFHIVLERDGVRMTAAITLKAHPKVFSPKHKHVLAMRGG